MKTLIAISGATGIGKTEMAILLANHFNTEIISADSRQFFKEMNIGVARPSTEELARAKHHFIAHISIHESFSAGQFEVAALQKLDEIFSVNDYAICVGGSGLYLDALINGLDDLPSDHSVKQKYVELLNKEGIQRLQELLKEKDFHYFEKVDLSNPHRLIRALEIIEITGKSYTSLRTALVKKREFNVKTFILTAERDFIYQRINKRVDMMLEQGLLEEAWALFPYQNLNALNTVGYKELFDAWNNNTDLSLAVELIKQHTRNYAKRQETWWRRNTSVSWINVDQEKNAFDQIIELL
ncbi:MAG: tRNA (adenosine(37)-N6)-dimethylallyltransferase MiaA [Flavobacteriales bacterium]|jgi:tRNA dimethylallyltransferase